MSESIREYRPVSYRRARRGQTLIVAIAVLFVLLFIGGVFVALVANNLAAAGRGRDVQDAQALADAGIQFCKDQLIHSMDGADWRPAPTAPLTSAVDTQGATDPDAFWLAQKDASGNLKGFSRIAFPGGRALIRVSYEPRPDDPRSQLLKIESVGRPGDLGNGLDPTVAVQSGVTIGPRREALGYMQIGLTDYLRFFTNKDKLNIENFVGVPALGPPVAMALGDPTLGERTDGKSADGKYILFGGGIRSNGDLKLSGPLNFYFSAARPIEGIQTNGKIKIESPDAANPSDQVFVNQVVNPPTIDLTKRIYASSDTQNHTTNQGYVRDGSSQSDPFGFPNGIPTLLPPILETKTDGTGVLRYRALTRDSGQWYTDKRHNTGEYGWGRGIYIDNFGDQQEETSRPGIVGGYSLRSDWLNPNSQFAHGYWQGPFYRPPGVLIELLGDRIRLTRSDDRSFRKPDGSPITALGGKVIEIPLSDLDRDNYVLPDGTPYPLPHLDRDGDEPDASDPSGANRPFGDKQSYGVNLVIMAEGNVRVKGAYGVVTDANGGGTTLRMGRVHLTLVSGGTAYIEGNVVKGDGFMNGPGSTQHLERASTCAILANDYVCVNTTMFMTPENQTNVFTRVPGDIDAYDVAIGLSRPTFDMSWSFGVPYTANTYTTNGQVSPFFLLLRHASEYPGPSYLNLMINPAQALDAGLNPLYQFNILAASPGTYILGQKFDPTINAFVADGTSLFPSFERIALPLTGNPLLPPTPGIPNLFRFQPDQSVQALQGQVTFAGATDYLLGSAMVAPMDIRIEALLYAQNNSFFVIPGYPQNPNPADTRQAFLATGRRPSYRIGPPDANNPNGVLMDSAEEKQAKDVFPFYDDPVDVRITIYGAVSENYAASAGDQKAWMARWGYIPAQHGSSGIAIPDDHLRGHAPGPNVTGMDYGYVPGEDRDLDIRTQAEQQGTPTSPPIARGLRFVYDPALAMPYLNPADATLDGETGGSETLRQQRALRSRTWELKNFNTQDLGTVKQILPPTPRLPVCPGLLYVGDPDRRIGK